MKNLNYYVESLKRIEAVRAEFSLLGFKVPEVEQRHIEAVRARPESENKYSYYSTEKLLESLSFPRGLWRKSGRDIIPLVYRSSYLDDLCKKIDVSIFKGDNKDQPNVYMEVIDRNVDPNHLIFSRLGMANPSLADVVHRDIEEQHANERLFFSEKLERFLQSVKDIRTSKGLFSLFCAIAEDAHLPTPIKIERNAGFYVCFPLRTNRFLRLTWTDEVVLRKWGALQLAYTFDEVEEKVSDPNGFQCGLEQFIPGGARYAQNTKNDFLIVLGVLAHMEFARLLAFEMNKN